MTFAHITGWGMSVPESILTNDDLSKMVETNDKWIREQWKPLSRLYKSRTYGPLTLT